MAASIAGGFDATRGEILKVAFPFSRRCGYHPGVFMRPGMTRGAIAFVLTAFVLATSVTPSLAYDWLRRPHSYEWRDVHRAINELNKRIAFLEANPDIDESYKGPIIQQLRADIYRLRSTLYPADWEWATPCCYGRPPIHIR
jgi:hypothetical protein